MEARDFFFQAIDPFGKPPVIDNDTDYNWVLDKLLQHRMGGVAYQTLIQANWDALPDYFRTALETIHNEYLEFAPLMTNRVKMLSKYLHNLSCPYAFLKGAILIPSVYPPGTRISDDIDILINAQDIDLIQDRLLCNGFIQGHYDKSQSEIVPATRRELVNSRINFGETIPFLRIDSDSKRVFEVDLNFSVDYQAKNGKETVAALLNNVQQLNIQGDIAFTLSTVDFLIHLCCHLYKEDTTYDWINTNSIIYKYFDVYYLLSVFGTPDFYHTLRNRSIELKTDKECYYTFFNLLQIFARLHEDIEFSKFLKAMQPVDLSFMKTIIWPSKRKVFSYDCSFVDWIFEENRAKYLRDST